MTSMVIYVSLAAGWPTCGCDRSLMRIQLWEHTNTCYELHSRGPCVTGHVFHYNATSRTTQCACDPSMTANYHQESQQCYPLDTRGPCPPGHIFTLPLGAQVPLCTCLEGHLLHEASGTCQRAYTRAVCTSGQFLRPDASAGVGVGRCATVPCSNTGHLYNPDTDQCYPVGSVGPCPIGKLWVYERASSLRGRCHCDKELVGYWEPHDICYPLGEQGPCPSRHVVTYSATRGLACSCDKRRGYSRWKGRCERITTADIIRDLLSSNLMDPHEAHLNNVIRSRSIDFDRLLTVISTPADIISTTPEPPVQLPTTGNTTSTQDPTEELVPSGDLPNSIEATQQKSGRQSLDESDISQRIARLTHRGLITRRARRTDQSSQQQGSL